MEYSDSDLVYLAICSNKAIFISCVALFLFVWAICLGLSNFKQIARMKVECEELINDNKKERKVFK
jgi:hypothetical protein